MKRIHLILLSLIFLLAISGYAETSNSNNSKAALFWSKNAGTPATRFELAQNSTPELIAFIRLMPKGADLHNHVSGATYSDFILDSAEKSGLSFDLGANLFFDPKNPKYKPINPITITTLKENSIYLAQYLNIFSMRGWYPNTTNGHDQFFNTFNYMGSAQRSNDDMLVEVAKRNVWENIQYLELMISSLPSNYTNLFNDTAKDFSITNLDKAYNDCLETVKKASFDVPASIRGFFDDREKNLINNGISLGPGKDIVIRYIQQLKRSTNDMRGFFLSAFYSAYAANIDKRLAGINMVQAEDTPYSRNYFSDEMTILDYIWKKMKPSFSLHSGELVLDGSPVESMQNRISDTIKKGHASRIGHGVSIAWETDVPGILKYMRDNGILVEICITSNESILGVKEREHPFIMYRKAGVRTALSTDDEGVSRSNLTMEYVKAVERYDLSYDDVKDLSRNAVEYGFLPGESIYVNHDYAKIRDELIGVRDINYKPSAVAQKLIDGNPKLEREYAYERALVLFEQQLMNME
jgi:adenosine deaminase